MLHALLYFGETGSVDVRVMAKLLLLEIIFNASFGLIPMYIIMISKLCG
jgi:hypothetical protein